jgi:hypothetical protein
MQGHAGFPDPRCWPVLTFWPVLIFAVAYFGVGPVPDGIDRRATRTSEQVAGRAPRGIVEGRQILLHGAAGPLGIAIPAPILTRNRTLLVGVGCNKACVDGKPSPATRPAAIHVSTTRSNTWRKTLPCESARCGLARTPNDPGSHPRYRSCRTTYRQGSPAPRGPCSTVWLSDGRGRLGNTAAPRGHDADDYRRSRASQNRR